MIEMGVTIYDDITAMLPSPEAIFCVHIIYEKFIAERTELLIDLEVIKCAGCNNNGYVFQYSASAINPFEKKTAARP